NYLIGQLKELPEVFTQGKDIQELRESMQMRSNFFLKKRINLKEIIPFLTPGHSSFTQLLIHLFTHSLNYTFPHFLLSLH
ncbi:MAG: hypothetical protein ACQETJ_09230, partial [Bacteroidota bacterium]